MADTVAQYTVTAAVAAVRAATAHDSDTQFLDTSLTEQLDQDYRDLRRFIAQFAPTMYQKVEEFTLASGTITLAQRKHTKPVDYERLIRFEVEFSQGCWQPMSTRPILAASQGVDVDVGANYRMTYVAQPVDGYTAFDLPPGASRILVHLGAAWVRQREDDLAGADYHEKKAEYLKNQLRRDIVMRQGAHPVCALVHEPAVYGFRSFYEEGDHFIIV